MTGGYINNPNRRTRQGAYENLRFFESNESLLVYGTSDIPLIGSLYVYDDGRATNGIYELDASDLAHMAYTCAKALETHLSINHPDAAKGPGHDQ